MSVAEMSEVSFSYRSRKAIRGVSLELTTGITALLGPNGAGKSTLMKLLVGTLSPAQGTVKVPQHVGYLDQHFSAMGSLSLERTVGYAAWAAGVEPKRCYDLARRALSQVNLTDFRSKVKTLSGGQRQRLGVACALASGPELVVLDEPTVGIDPEQRASLRQDLIAIASRTSILISTHLVNDAVTMADRILVMKEGRIIFDGTVTGLEEMASGEPERGISLAEMGYLRIIAQDQR